MWIMTTDGFFSINRTRTYNTAGTVMVRARRRADLVRFIATAGCSDVQIIGTPAADYPWRIVIPNSIMRRYLSARVVAAVENFKDSVHDARPEDHTYHSFLKEVWSEGYHGMDDRRVSPRTTYADGGDYR
jgi:hypothetical protein